MDIWELNKPINNLNHIINFFLQHTCINREADLLLCKSAGIAKVLPCISPLFIAISHIWRNGIMHLCSNAILFQIRLKTFTFFNQNRKQMIYMLRFLIYILETDKWIINFGKISFCDSLPLFISKIGRDTSELQSL